MVDLQYVADRVALMDVMLRYAKGVDQRDMELYASVFADDVEVVGFGAETYRGRDAWVAYVKKALEAYGPTQHMLGPQLATVDGDAAHCRTDVQALHYMKDEPTRTPHPVGHLQHRHARSARRRRVEDCATTSRRGARASRRGEGFGDAL